MRVSEFRVKQIRVNQGLGVVYGPLVQSTCTLCLIFAPDQPESKQKYCNLHMLKKLRAYCPNVYTMPNNDDFFEGAHRCF